MKNKRLLMILLAGFSIFTLAVGGTARGAESGSPTVVITPNKTMLSPALIKKSPIQFSGAGWAPKEIVVIDLLIMPGLKVKGVKEDEKEIGIATAFTDDKGNFKTRMAPTATLNWFFQVGWTPKGPDFKTARPLPPGIYTIRALGMDSDRVCTATLEILRPPKRK